MSVYNNKEVLLNIIKENNIKVKKTDSKKVLSAMYSRKENTIYLNQENLQNLSDDEVGAIIAHEVGHALGIKGEFRADEFAAKLFGKENLLSGIIKSNINYFTNYYGASLESAIELSKRNLLYDVKHPSKNPEHQLNLRVMSLDGRSTKHVSWLDRLEIMNMFDKIANGYTTDQSKEIDVGYRNIEHNTYNNKLIGR